MQTLSMQELISILYQDCEFDPDFLSIIFRPFLFIGRRFFADVFDRRFLTVQIFRPRIIFPSVQFFKGTERNAFCRPCFCQQDFWTRKMLFSKLAPFFWFLQHERFLIAAQDLFAAQECFLPSMFLPALFAPAGTSVFAGTNGFCGLFAGSLFQTAFSVFRHFCHQASHSKLPIKLLFHKHCYKRVWI